MDLSDLLHSECGLLDEPAIERLLRGQERGGDRVLGLGDGASTRACSDADRLLGRRSTSNPDAVGEEPEDRDRAEDRRRPPQVGLLRPVEPGSVVSVGVILWGGHAEDCPVGRGRAQGGAPGFPPSYHRRR